MSKWDVHLRGAKASDTPTIERFITEATAWMQTSGIRQWLPGEFSTSDVAGWVEAGDTYVGIAQGRPVGSVRIQSADPLIWPDKVDDARYIHRLVIDRTYAGQGLGRAILIAAEQHAAHQCSTLRLDCGANNGRLVHYYLEAGYSYVDRRQEQTWLVARFEKRI